MPEGCSGLWRSEDMVLLQLHMQREAAHDTILKLGHLGCVQFREMNVGISAFQRLFTNDVRRCEDSERRLRYFEEQVRRERARRTRSRIGAAVDSASAVETLDTLEPKLEALESELRELNSKWEQLLSSRNSMKEHLEVLSQDPSFFRGEDESQGFSVVGVSDQAEDGGLRSGRLRYITGLLVADKVPLFERLVYRATRGNVFMRVNPARDKFEDPSTGEMLEKVIFVVFFSAQRAQDKIQKMCESLQASTFPYSQESETADKVREHIEDLNKTIQGTEEVRTDILQKVQQNIFQWKKTVVVEKSVYSVMNMLNFKGQTAVAECWAPKDDLDKVKTALSEAEVTSGAQVESLMEQVPTHEKPPTYFKTNKFTSTHQSIVSSYGIARYKEVNPTCFSVITFPFLFAVMYGDIGHGAMLTVLAAVFIIREKAMLASNMNEIIALVFGGRYVLFFMGILAIYLGFIYNDFFGTMVTPWGTPFWCFPTSYEDAKVHCDDGYFEYHNTNSSLAKGCKCRNGTPYGLGVDSDWSNAENKLEFMNGMKMKMAVILGVAQMLWGLALQLWNHWYFKDIKHIIFGFIPELLFLCCTFGYMDVMIIIKWCTDWPSKMLMHRNPPSLLETMTNFFLAPGSVENNKQLWGENPTSQNTIQVILLLVAVFCVPLLLIPIPCIEYHHHKAMLAARGTDRQTLADDHAVAAAAEEREDGTRSAEGGAENADVAEVGVSAEEEDHFDMSEVVIKQVIHTIEYVLGCVSNTASYLRLWALSLAHAELSEVFWDFAWMKPLTWDKGIGIIAFAGWGVWFGVTIGVLGVMESLSAFLHALRLHWVEFQNKFYFGDGTQFVPYDVSILVPKPFEQAAIE